jgi:ATP-binding cassette subfamily B protein
MKPIETSQMVLYMSQTKRTKTLDLALLFLAPYKRQISFALFALVFTASITLTIGQGVRFLIDFGFATSSSESLQKGMT